MSNDETFQAAGEADLDPALRVLLDAYGPVLRAGFDEARAAELDSARFVGALGPQDDVALAGALADRLYAPEAAAAFFPESAHEVLGPREQWSACLPYVRCWWMFGWLVCRGCRDYKALNYYLYRYWLCVRRALGAPEDRRDFERLAEILGATYRRWLRDELAEVELDGQVHEQVPRPDCCRDNAFTASLFEALATPEAAEALLGREALAAHVKHPYYWFCRCWYQAALRFGCCVACARTREELERCVREYREALEGCLGPLRCALTGPSGCVQDELEPAVNGWAVKITGTATGAYFSHYTIEWRMAEDGECLDDAHWSSADVVYPNGSTVSGTAPVLNGVLGWINTTYHTARSYEVRVCLHSTQHGPRPPCCCTEFNLFKRFVWISGVVDAVVEDVFDPRAPLVNPATKHLVTVGCCWKVYGSAWVGECNDRKIECFDLRYGVGCLPGPMDAGFDPAAFTGSLLPAPVCYTPPDENQKRAQYNQVLEGALTTQLQQVSFPLPKPMKPIKMWRRVDFCFRSHELLPLCPDQDHYCRSGEYTLLLDVWDTHGNHYYDTQCIWVDNKPLHVELAGFPGVPSCRPMSLKKFSGGKPCAARWPWPLRGIAYDEYITGLPTYPSDNFDYYAISITRGCGGPTWQLPITPDLVNFYKDILTGTSNPRKGTAHIGDPGTRCEIALGCAPPPAPSKQLGTLTLVDLRAFDAVCAPHLPPLFQPPAGFPLKRGECCCYVIQLYAQDKTWSSAGHEGSCHAAWAKPCTVYICNDLPAVLTDLDEAEPFDVDFELGELAQVEAGPQEPAEPVALRPTPPTIVQDPLAHGTLATGARGG